MQSVKSQQFSPAGYIFGVAHLPSSFEGRHEKVKPSRPEDPLQESVESLGAESTSILAECFDCLMRLAVEVQFPRKISLVVGFPATPRGHLILTGKGLAVENEKGRDFVFLPRAQVLFDARLYAGDTAQGG